MLLTSSLVASSPALVVMLVVVLLSSFLKMNYNNSNYNKLKKETKAGLGGKIIFGGT